MSAANALTAKYELLRQRNREKLAKQKEQERAGEGAPAPPGSPGVSGPAVGGGSSAADPGGDQRNDGKEHGGAERSKRKATEAEPSTVSAADLDRSIIAAVQASTSATRSKAAAHVANSKEPTMKRARMTSQLPTVDKKPGRQTGGEEGDGVHASLESRDGGAPRSQEGQIGNIPMGRDDVGGAQKRLVKNGGAGKMQGLLPNVCEALERVLAEVGLPTDEVEQKVLSALQDMPEQVGLFHLPMCFPSCGVSSHCHKFLNCVSLTVSPWHCTMQEALRVIEQFASGDMSRIRNKGAYLWGIVRNVQAGMQSGRGKGMTYGGDSAPSAQDVDGSMKMLWPEEEQVTTYVIQPSRYNNHEMLYCYYLVASMP